ncbi:hypothetical protein ACFLU2_01895 [Chloroflexota bacterium]
MAGILTVACEPLVTITVENQFPVDLTIVYEAVNHRGSRSEAFIMGAVPSGQTVKIQRGLIPRPSLAGYFVLFRAEDPSGKIVWQRLWLFEEFFEDYLKFEQMDRQITISPGQNSPPSSQFYTSPK